MKHVGYSLKLCFLIICVCASTAPALLARELLIYDDGLSQYSLTRYEQAANEWVEIAKRYERLEIRDTVLIKRAAFAYVLSTLAYEKNNDARAYDSWFSALDLYSRAGTSWRAEREVIAKRVKALREKEKKFVEEELMRQKMRSDDLILLRISDLTKVTHYDGPRPGLLQKNVSENGERLQPLPRYLLSDERILREVYAPLDLEVQSEGDSLDKRLSEDVFSMSILYPELFTGAIFDQLLSEQEF